MCDTSKYKLGQFTAVVTSPLIVISSPATCPEPPSMIVTVGVDEPSVVTSAVVPEDEPPVTATPLYVPGVPPVPPAIVVI